MVIIETLPLKNVTTLWSNQFPCDMSNKARPSLNPQRAYHVLYCLKIVVVENSLLPSKLVGKPHKFKFTIVHSFFIDISWQCTIFLSKYRKLIQMYTDDILKSTMAISLSQEIATDDFIKKLFICFSLNYALPVSNSDKK